MEGFCFQQGRYDAAVSQTSLLKLLISLQGVPGYLVMMMLLAIAVVALTNREMKLSPRLPWLSLIGVGVLLTLRLWVRENILCVDEAFDVFINKGLQHGVAVVVGSVTFGIPALAGGAVLATLTARYAPAVFIQNDLKDGPAWLPLTLLAVFSAFAWFGPVPAILCIVIGFFGSPFTIREENKTDGQNVSTARRHASLKIIGSFAVLAAVLQIVLADWQ